MSKSIANYEGGGELIDMLPETMKTPDVAAFSYALKMAVLKVLALQKRTSVYGNIDALPEDILDLLAIENRSPYYDNSLPIGTKREIIKNTLAWHSKAGSVAAVEEMVKTVFGDGKVIEWFDFDEDKVPGQFDIITGGDADPASQEKLLRVIASIKNISSHLRRLTIRRKAKTTLYAGTVLMNRQRYVAHPAVMNKSTKRVVSMQARGSMFIYQKMTAHPGAAQQNRK